MIVLFRVILPNTFVFETCYPTCQIRALLIARHVCDKLWASISREIEGYAPCVSMSLVHLYRVWFMCTDEYGAGAFMFMEEVCMVFFVYQRPFTRNSESVSLGGGTEMTPKLFRRWKSEGRRLCVCERARVCVHFLCYTGLCTGVCTVHPTVCLC